MADAFICDECKTAFAVASHSGYRVTRLRMSTINTWSAEVDVPGEYCSPRCLATRASRIADRYDEMRGKLPAVMR